MECPWVDAGGCRVDVYACCIPLDLGFLWFSYDILSDCIKCGVEIEALAYSLS